jgi:hypothetical protein
MPYLRNPFPIIKEYISLRDYEIQINQVLEKFFKMFFEKFEILSINRAKNTFWSLADNTTKFSPFYWYDIFAVFMLRLFSTKFY